MYAGSYEEAKHILASFIVYIILLYIFTLRLLCLKWLIETAKGLFKNPVVEKI